MSNKEELYAKYDALCERANALHKEVWSRKGYVSKQKAASDAKGKYERMGEKEADLVKFGETLPKLEEQVTTAETEQSKWFENRQALAAVISPYQECIAAEDFPVGVTRFQSSIEKIGKELTALGMDKDTHVIAKFMNQNKLPALIAKVDNFVKDVEKFKAQPKWKPSKADKSKAQRIIKASEDVMKTLQPLLTKDGKQETVETITGLLRDLKDGCERDQEEFDIGEIQYRVGQLKKDYAAALDRSKKSPAKKSKKNHDGKCVGPDCAKRTAKLVAKDLCFSCLEDDNEFARRVTAYRDNTEDFKAVATPMQKKHFKNGLTLSDIKKLRGETPDEDDEFTLVHKPVKTVFDNAYEAFVESKGKNDSYDALIKALEEAEKFFSTMEIPHDVEEDSDEERGSEDSVEFEESSEEEESSSSSSSSDEDIAVSRKRSRDNDDSDFLPQVIRAMDLAEPEERKRIRSLYESQELGSVNDLVRAINLRHSVHYEIKLFRPDGSPPISEHLLHFFQISNNHICDSREEAERRVKLFKIDEISNLNYRIEEVRPQ